MSGGGAAASAQDSAPRGSSRAPPPARPAGAGKLRPGRDVSPANGRARALDPLARRGRGQSAAAGPVWAGA